jgi:hypothetical protein
MLSGHEGGQLAVHTGEERTHRRLGLQQRRLLSSEAGHGGAMVGLEALE